MNILGLDQASKCGYSIFKDDKLYKYGIFDVHDITEKTNGKLYYQDKINDITRFVCKIIESYDINLVIIEDIQKQINISTYKKLAWMQGAIIQALYDNKISFSILSPSQWRSGALKIKGVSRKRTDVKIATIQYVESKFDITATEDECDAICIGYAGNLLLNKNKLLIYKNEF